MTSLGMLGPAAYDHLSTDELQEQLSILDDRIFYVREDLDVYIQRRALCTHTLIKKLSGGVQGLEIDQNL